ncbi:PREDICTED: interaptin-like [Condylura cristata]|uniref:interaptin-like n=1 Tax=Condylura cristata TaxID=143302 RepID=UPI000642F949|nr:PREDICTED: interaptin-like [Condylura cristata]
MMSSADSEDSCLPSKTRSSKIEDNYLKELNEELKLRKQELLEILKPLENKNNLLLQKLMSNLEEKQNSLQIMRQIMAGKGSDDESSVMELIKEAEEMKQNLERKNKMLRNEMEMLWNKTLDTEEYSDQLKTPQIKNTADSQDAEVLQPPLSPRKIKSELETCELKEIKKEKKQRKMEWVRCQDPVNIYQNDFHGKVMELRIGALKNYQKSNDLKLSLYLQQNSGPKQTFFNLPGAQGTMATTTIGRATTSRNDSNSEQKKDTNRKDEAGREPSFVAHSGLCYISPPSAPTQLSEPPPGSLAPSGGPSVVARRGPTSPCFPSALQRAVLRPGQPDRGADPQRRARQGIASVWGSAEEAFRSRAHPFRVLPANRALLARPETLHGLSQAGPLLPAPSTRQQSSLLPSLSTSYTPRGVAPPQS